MDEEIVKEKQDTKFFKKKTNTILLLVSFFILISYYFLSAPYNNRDLIIHISSGQSVISIGKELKEKNSIRNIFLLRAFIKLLKSGNGIVTGDYLINKNSPVYSIAWQISRGNHNIEQIKITLREGLNNEQIASILADKIISFRKDLFISGVLSKQGYLFPDTYFFFPLDTTDEIIKKLSDNFKRRTNSIEQLSLKNGINFKNIIIMASILEGEAKGKDDIELISGILWKRIELGMPLQVDVDKSTYKEKGLPNEPLNNPGLISIKAALNPIRSPYLYYLHDKNGIVHFAKSFEEHKKNINNYLK
jgi:UPF0755 protein